MLIEMHCHTEEHSRCSFVSAADLVRRIHAKGLQGIVLTDHHYLWPEKGLEALRRRAGVPEHFLIFSGQEVKTPELGDVLVYGADVSLPAGTPLSEIRRRFPGAALVWAHPYRSGRLPTEADLRHPLLDGIEIFNSNQSVRENCRGLQQWHQLRFTAIAGTDTHGISYAGLYPTLFDHPLSDLAELAAELKKGRCRPFLKEIPKAGSKNRVTEVTIGAKGMDEIRERIIIKTLDTPCQWSKAERAHHILQNLAEHGFARGPYRVPLPIDEDSSTLTLIEEGVRGRSLFDRLLGAPKTEGRRYLQLTARWLARLHNCRLLLTPGEEFLTEEQRRLPRYVQRFLEIGHPHSRRASEIMEVIDERERRLLSGRPELLIQGHGDFHPKNVLLGQDRQDDPSTLFVAAIDFESSLALPPAFDVGSFLAQFRNQFFAHPRILADYPEELFLSAYLEERSAVEDDFHGQVELFFARSNLSIAAYLIKVGMGGSEDLWRVLLEAEQALSAGMPAPGAGRDTKAGAS
jgi:hypothetical protein